MRGVELLSLGILVIVGTRLIVAVSNPQTLIRWDVAIMTDLLKGLSSPTMFCSFALSSMVASDRFVTIVKAPT